MSQKYLVLLLFLFLISCAEQESLPTIQSKEQAVIETVVTPNQSIADFLSFDPLYNILYTVQSNQEGKEETLRIVKEGLRVRKDILTKKGEARILKNEDGTTACYLISGDWACSQGTMPELEIEQRREFLNQAFSQSKSRNLLGTLATCFSGSKLGVSMEYCFSPEGIILYAKMTQGENTTLYSAVSYTQNISKDLWKVP